jgi:hypothetical protein
MPAAMRANDEMKNLGVFGSNIDTREAVSA